LTTLEDGGVGADAESEDDDGGDGEAEILSHSCAGRRWNPGGAWRDARAGRW